jgi:hypothetical protein
MANVEPPIGLGGKPRDDGAAVFTGLAILRHDFSDEIARRRFRAAFGTRARHLRAQFSHMAELQANAREKH